MDNYNKPSELVQIYINAAISKACMPFDRLLVLSFLAGAFIGFGAEFCTVAITGTVATLGFGASKILGAACFSLGLMLVVICGGELFTGNCPMVAALPRKKIGWRGMLYNWLVSYCGNCIGGLAMVAIVVYGGTWASADAATGITALQIGAAKCGMSWSEALARGVACNWLVCLAVWMGLASKDIVSKIWCIFFPIAAFVAVGFEHCIANIYFIPKALVLKGAPQMAAFAAENEALLANLNWGQFITGNLIPVTIGNIIGGVFFVGLLYYVAYRPAKTA